MVVPKAELQPVYRALMDAWLRLRPSRMEHDDFLALLGIFETAHKKEPETLIQIYKSITSSMKKTPADEKAPPIYDLDD